MSEVSDREVLELFRTQLGKPYIYGENVDLTNPDPPAFDCAEFGTWGFYQALRRLYGCVDNNLDPENPAHDPEPYSGGWAADAMSGRLIRTTIDAALVTPAVALIRRPRKGKIGHVAISNGEGGTVEAHSTKYGVSEHGITGRQWDFACLVPGVTYRSAIASPLPKYEPPKVLLRIGSTGPLVVELKRALAERGYWHLPLDSDTAPIYGAQTAAAVARFQLDHGLVRDGEAGPQTLGELGIDWRKAA